MQIYYIWSLLNDQFSLFIHADQLYIYDHCSMISSLCLSMQINYIYIYIWSLLNDQFFLFIHADHLYIYMIIAWWSVLSVYPCIYYHYHYQQFLTSLNSTNTKNKLRIFVNETINQTFDKSFLLTSPTLKIN